VPESRPSASQTLVEPVCAWLALVVPLGMTVLRVGVAAQWRDDLALVRSLGLVPIGGEGVLSTVLTQLFGLVPLGGRVMRAALVGALGLAVSSRLLYAVARRALGADGKGGIWIPPLLSLAAALGATLAPTWQLEGTIAGGATLAVALTLAALLLRPASNVTDARVWIGYGGLAAASVLESHAAGVALLLMLLVQMFVVGDFPARRNVVLCLAGGAVVTALCLVPMLLRPYATRAWIDLGYDLLGDGLTAGPVASGEPDAVRAWASELGLGALVLAAVGTASALLRRRTRWVVAPLLAPVAADVLLPTSSAGILAPGALTPVRLLAVAALSTTAAVGVYSLVGVVRRLRLPFARAACALVVLFHFTLIVLASEDSAYVADRRAQRGAEVWTDEALADLPPRSLLLVRSPAIVWRLWAARVVRGERPDLVVVPMALLERGSLARRLLTLEPALGPLIREVAINEAPSEFALSALADQRPLHVEFDPAWDVRLLDHFVPRPLWLRFAPHALGRSDRRASLRDGRAAFERVLASAATAEHRDAATLAVLTQTAREQSAVLAALGDRQELAVALADLRSIDAEDRFVAEVERRLGDHQRGRVDVRGLLQ